MSTIYRILCELLFLVLHPKGPRMSIVAACRYLRESEGWIHPVIKQYKRFGHVDFSEERGPKESPQKPNLSSDRLKAQSRQRRGQLKSLQLKKPQLVDGQQLGDFKGRKIMFVGRRFLEKTFCPKSKSNLDRDWYKVIFTESTFELNCQVTRA